MARQNVFDNLSEPIGLLDRSYRASAGATVGHTPQFGSNLAFRRDEWVRVRASVHRDDAMVHDDFDLAYHLGPDARMRWDPQFMVRIDRPSLVPSSVLLRIRRGLRTVFIHWPQELPWKRWRHRFTTRRRRSAEG